MWKIDSKDEGKSIIVRKSIPTGSSLLIEMPVVNEFLITRGLLQFDSVTKRDAADVDETRGY